MIRELWYSFPYEDQIVMIIFVLAALLLLIDFLFILRWLYLLVKRIGQWAIAQRKTKPREVAETMVTALVRDPDPLSELVRYADLTDKGKVSSTQGPEVVRIFFQELSSRWKLCEIGPFDSVTKFDSHEHRSKVPIAPGELVRVIKPGWKLGEQVIKPAIVMQEGDSHK